MNDKNRKYSKGVFLHAIGGTRSDWRKQVGFINSLPGIEHVEVMIEEDLTQSEVGLIKSLLKKYRIIVHAPFIEINPVSCHPEIREVASSLYIKTIRIAKTMGAGVVTVHPGKINIFQSKETGMRLLIETLKKVKSHQGKGLKVAVENLPPHEGMFGNFISKLKEFISLKKALPGIHFTLDVGHALRGGEDQKRISDFLRKHKDSVLDIHFHDAVFCGKKDHLALGEGDLNFRSFLKLLKDINYTGYLSLEIMGESNTRNSWMKIRKL